MRDDQGWPDSDADEPTQPIPRVDLPPPTRFLAPPEDELAEEILAVGDVARPERSPAKRFLGRALMVAGGVIALGVVLYTIDLMASAGDVPRGVVVAGVEVGGLSPADAEAKLRRELEPRLIQPVPVLAGDVQTALDPVTSGLGLDWASTLAQAGHQPLDPWTRITSFFVKRSVGLVTMTDDKALTEAISQLATERINHPPTEGSVGFQPVAGTDGDVTPYAVEPRDGQTLNDVKGAANLVKARWLEKSGVRLAVDLTPVLATSAGVHKTLDQVVRPAVANPVALHGDGVDALLKPAAIAAAMRFTPRPTGALDATLDAAKLRENLQPQLVSTEKAGQNAQLVFTDSGPTVRPSQDARKIDWMATFTPMMSVLTRADGREVSVRYQSSRPEVTTEDLTGLGIKEVVAEFTTSGLSGAAAANVRTMAAKVTGAVVRPGQTFSLNDRSGPWSQAQGFVPAPANEDGTGPQVAGGGVSQFATTLYNAAYYAGLTDAGHREHGYYLDRYSPGRDARSFSDDGSPVDLRFTNSLTGGVAIQAVSTGPTVTVRIWGTRQFRVESTTSDWSDFAAPPVQQGSGGGCQQSLGGPGFTVTDIRIRYDLATGAEVGRETRVVHYEPKPAVFCT
ncbi:MAG TPA: VanW family protein [Amycolatopsis sp.]|uniref:VanW family protein n=1 Tax=Amycolatopsis sp. TaxID=37632 RepID=UPI002B463539|nr:VanW family protein [Amycolatopsis sp.]HKS46276.1 VanW family protein [Amycolatopsis sp.]